MEKILVPTDFSIQAEHALKMAISIAKKNNAQIELVHVVEVSTIPQIATIGDLSLLPLTGNQDLITDAKKKLIKLVEKHAHESITIHQVVITDIEKGYTGIKETLCHYQGINLIVMGSKGSSGAREVFIGSNTEYVVKHAAVPVLVVKEKVEQVHHHCVVYPLSFEKTSSKLMKAIHKYTIGMNADLHLLYVNTALDFQSDEQIRGLYKKFIADHDFGKHTFAINNAFSEEKGIIDYVSLTKADLIIMPTHGRTGLANLFSTSVTDDIVNHSHVSVLTFNLKNY